MDTDASSAAKRMARGLVVSMTLMAFGCASSYRPRPSRLITLTMDGGGLQVNRDGRAFPLGGFGGGLEQAVAGNPEAEAAARSYHRRMVSGLALDLTGWGLLLAGLITTTPAQQGASVSNARQIEGGVMAGAGLISITAALALILTGAPKMWDAINIYNDGVPPWPIAPNSP